MHAQDNNERNNNESGWESRLCKGELRFLPSLSPAVSTPFRRGGARGPEKRVVGLKKRRRKGKKRGETKEGLAEGRKKGSSRRNNKASSREDVFFPPSRGEKKKRDPRPSSCVCTYTHTRQLFPTPFEPTPCAHRTHYLLCLASLLIGGLNSGVIALEITSSPFAALV